MRKLQIICLFGWILFAGSLSAQDGGKPKAGSENKGWSHEDRYGFLSECIKAASNGVSKDVARFYCYCMQEKVEKDYPAVDEAAKIIDEDMQTPKWQDNMKTCLGGTWDSTSRENFLSSCVEKAREVSGEKAQSYCECMLFKVEKMYPDPADAVKLTPEKLNSPEWKKIIQGCVDF